MTDISAMDPKGLIVYVCEGVVFRISWEPCLYMKLPWYLEHGFILLAQHFYRCAHHSICPAM